MRSWGLATALLALFVAGCSHTAGELGNLHFNLRLADQLVEFESGDRILLGSRLCPQLESGLREDGTQRSFHGKSQSEAARACYQESVEGPASLDAEGCFALAGPGEMLWSLTPTGACEFGEDRLRFMIVAPGPELRLGFDDWRARAPSLPDTDVTLIGLAPGRTLADLREDPAALRLVVVDALDVPQMRLDVPEGRVYWTPALPLELVGEGVTRIEPDPDDDSSAYLMSGELALRLEIDATARVRMTLPDGQIRESPELIGVAASTAASLDLVVLVETETGDPLYAFAEVRDAQARVLHGAPVEWSMQEGALVVYPGALNNEIRTAEYAALVSNCEPPSALPIQRRAVLRARLGELEDTVTLVWFDEPALPEQLAKPFVPGENCLFADGSKPDQPSDPDDEDDSENREPKLDDTTGCGCTSDDRGAPLWGLLSLLGLGLLGRRRGAILR